MTAGARPVEGGEVGALMGTLKLMVLSSLNPASICRALPL